MFRRVAGRPVLPRMDLVAPAAGDGAVPAQDRVRAASSRSPWRRTFGITPARAASSARSAHASFGRAAGWRCRTTSCWRKITISAIFCASSRRDSRSHAANQVIRRKTNRKHMNR
jgi:hypothetical protein